MALRIEIKRNYRGLFDVREGDLDGAVTSGNLDLSGVLDSIKDAIELQEFTIE